MRRLTIVVLTGAIVALAAPLTGTADTAPTDATQVRLVVFEGHLRSG